MDFYTIMLQNEHVSVGQIAEKLFTNSGFWSAVVASIFIIGLGIFMSKIKFVKNNFEIFKQCFNNLVITIAIPALVLSVYMSNLKMDDLINLSVVLGLSSAYTIIFHILAFVVAKWYPRILPEKWLVKKYKMLFRKDLIAWNNGNDDINSLDISIIMPQIKTEHRNLIIIQWLMVLNSSLIFFGLPMIEAIYGVAGSQIVLIFQIMPVIFTYTVALVAFSRIKFDKENLKQSLKSTFLNPMMIAMFIGLSLWLTQLIPNASDFTGPWWEINEANPTKNGWFNFSVTFPPIYKIVTFLGGMVSPLVWIVTGLNISKLKLKEILKNKNVWILLFIKYLLVPVVAMEFFIGLIKANAFVGETDYFLGGINTGLPIPSYVAVPSTCMVLLATPTTPIFTAYAVKYQNNEDFVSSTVGITALFSAFMMPIWFIISYLIFYIV